MKRRWLAYLLVGALFGAFDFVYLGFLYQVNWRQVPGLAGASADFLAFFVLNLGIWLIPVVPVAMYESRLSRSRLRAAAASMLAWCTAIVAYYLTNAGYLFFWGLPTRPELHVSNRDSAHFWVNWASVFQGDILGGIGEWTVVAVVGGTIVGLLVSSVCLLLDKPLRVRRTH